LDIPEPVGGASKPRHHDELPGRLVGGDGLQHCLLAIVGEHRVRVEPVSVLAGSTRKTRRRVRGDRRVADNSARGAGERRVTQ
jgi:hypothetical protein